MLTMNIPKMTTSSPLTQQSLPLSPTPLHKALVLQSQGPHPRSCNSHHRIFVTKCRPAQTQLWDRVFTSFFEVSCVFQTAGLQGRALVEMTSDQKDRNLLSS